ncbi:PREDICTED: calcium [Prunus dulcis]|uniref:PREDICTED: calcium n=2 Tax=Prunus dulcis TaxID=3755 RepID=A0A5E4G3T7_PRUDU|nr:uncharacterized protein LOC117618875 isoform X1 [Prunus dulcis]XP_034204520.1 uncharacterized protein LOC117618875 isoform X1 [Prunus dulcis]XP_034204521.1 uncharacterized protein LOC117618875 isoform X1 [Prunus dulcis]XP_034204522.1 uncharacterized protein LOC117618875 isoform X1 [Prunus dulcis]XP_034204523.1 uncharacterized protein LOC117618875 isoform X1 [Prunus dulcis]VVA34366.1 PREDICTED: calcium [Prunus dulcis]
MAFHRTLKSKSGPSSSIIFPAFCIAAIVLLFFFASLISTNPVSSPEGLESVTKSENNDQNDQNGHEKFLYWGNRIDCPGRHCESCEGLGHQESSLRCALEEAMFLKRTLVMPSRMCINPIHNKKGILRRSNTANSEETWAAKSCSMDSLYDMDLISDTVPVILDNSKLWYQVLTTSMKLGARGVAHVERVSRVDLKENSRFSNLLLINRTASPLSWFMECKDRNNRSPILLPYSFLPSMAAKNLRNVADKIKALLGDYDAIHVRRGDKIKTRKDRFGVDRTLHPHLDRDTRPEFILHRIEKWVPPGRTLFIASNERTPEFFSPLTVRYKLAYSSNFSHILDPVIGNNYQLFMVERLIMMGAKKFIRTFKEDDTYFSLTDDPKKNSKLWKMPVSTMDEDGKQTL